jgi:DNA-binding CsgD family transcriptional regulator/PAS domain-containing protein
MAPREGLLATIEAVHGAGIDATLWPEALAAITQIIGGRFATIEAFDKRTLRHNEFFAHGMPPIGQIEYLDHYAALNLRLRSHVTAKIDEVICDYRILDEEKMRRAPFYAEFLPRIDCRYFVSGIIATSAQEFAAVTVQRSARQGHIDRVGIATMRQLVPHVRQAFDVARRFKSAGKARHSLERALDWLADGVALLRADGAIVYANDKFQEIVRRDDGIRVRKGAIEFDAAETRDRFNAAMGSVRRLLAGDSNATPVVDFTVARPSARQAYFISIRPLVGTRDDGKYHSAIAAVFVRDPLSRSAAAVSTLRQFFGFTEAEAKVAQALQGGMPLPEYARTQALSLNKVYTHLRRVREKTGCNRMPELLRKLNDFHLPLRVD